MVNDLDYEDIEFPSLGKILARLKRKIVFALMCFVIEIIYFNLFIDRIAYLKFLWIYWW